MKTRRFLSILLCALLIWGLQPAGVNAAENAATDIESVDATEEEIIETETADAPIPDAAEETVSEKLSEGFSGETENEALEEADALEQDFPAFEQSRTVNGVTVTVSADAGIFPENAALSVTQVPASEVEAAIEEERKEGVNVASSYTFDIKVVDEAANELQPSDGQSVKVSFSLAEVTNDNLETKVWHVAEDETQGTLSAEELNVASEGRTVTAETDGFSYYTVEFTYGDLQYVLPGDKSVPLSVILDTVGLCGNATEVKVSNESLFSASCESGKWVVTSHQPFNTTEKMVVVIEGIEYEITVTDYQGTLYYYDENGNQIKLTEWFHIESSDDNLRSFIWNDHAYNQYAVHAGENVTYDRRIDVKNDVILILGDGATLTIKGGIHVSEGNSLTIYRQKQGTGKLIITDVDRYCAGIGGNDEEACGNVRICGGYIEVTAGIDGAGIGGGANGNGGHITIVGGTVTAYSGEGGAAIGGGSGYSYDRSGHGGNIKITGGTVSAYSENGGAGIGGGWYSDGGTIMITGGSVTSDGGPEAAGIGGGEYGGAGNVTITGGTVTASSGTVLGLSANAQAIGHGMDNSNEGSLTIGDASQGVYMRAGRVSGQTVAWADAADRMNVCRSDYNATIRIEPCASHEFTAYINNHDGTHTAVCKYCGSPAGTENHTYTDGVCVCGAEDLSGIDFGLINDIPPADGGYVWMGGDSPVKWQVIGANDSNWLLISSDLISGNGNIKNWYDAKNYCGTLFSDFSGAEQAAVPVTAKSEPDDYSYESNYGSNFGPSSVNANTFLLSSEEAETYFSSNPARQPGLWWLRSPFLTSDSDARAGIVFGSGTVGNAWVYNPDFGVRPAFQLNLESVLFSSAAEGGKSTAAAGSGEFGTLIKASGDINNEIKLTLIDSAMAGFSASEDSTTASPGGSLVINYSGAGTKEGEYVSALLCDESGNILYYASKTPDSSGSGTWDMTIPYDLENGNYTLKVFCEKQNRDKKTDYAGTPISISLAVNKLCTLTGVVEWNDNDNERNMRPESITAHLMANDEEVGTKEITEENIGIWSFSFDELPVEDAKGNVIVYSIEVDEIPEYETEVEKIGDYGFIIKNTLPEPVKIPLTITALPQKYTYIGQTQGEGDTAYEDPAELAEKVSVEGLRDGDSLASIVLDGQGKDAGEYDLVASNACIVNAAGDTVTDDYVITCETGTLTIDPAGVTITVDDASKVVGERDPSFTGTVEGLIMDGDLGEIKFVRTGSDEGAGTYEDALTATYTENKNYTVTVVPGDFTIKTILTLRWLDGDGSVLQEKTYVEGETAPAYDGKKPTKAGTVQYTYTFSDWDDGTVEGTVTTYKPLFGETVNQYTVTFMDYDGKTVLKEAARYDYGTSASDIVLPEKPKREADAQYTYTFTGWTPEIKEVTEDAVYTAVYSSEKQKYTITWLQDDGSEIDRTTVEYGETPVHADPVKAADAKYTYTFAGWDPEITEVTGDAAYKATYTATPVPVKKGKLTFDLGGGTLDGKTGTVTIEANVGDTIRLPKAPAREGYKFLYWKGSRYEAGAEYKVEGDHAFTAVWEENKPITPTATPTAAPTRTPGKSGGTAPKTGDADSMGTWAMLIVISALGIGAALFIRKRYEKN